MERIVTGLNSANQPQPAAWGTYRPDPFLPKVRRWLWIAFLLAIANGLFLYLFPAQAETSYAWAIKPPINAAFLGAGYFSGILTSALALFATRHWRSVNTLLLSFILLGAFMLIATGLHTDKFKWDYPLTWAWTLVYALIPPGAFTLWWIQQRYKGPLPPVDPQINYMRWFAWPLGVIMLVGGLLLFIFPDAFLSHWPWQITLLLGRTFAPWYIFKGATLILCAATARQPHELLIPFQENTVWSALLLLLLPLNSGILRTGLVEFWIWLGLHVVLLFGCGWITFRSYRQMRTANQTL